MSSRTDVPSPQQDEAFSVQGLEHAAYRGRFDEAEAQILALLAHQDAQYGALGDVGQKPSGDYANDRRDTRIATRIASAITALFAHPGYQPSTEAFRRLISFHRWLAVIFGASSFGNADHILHTMLEQHPAGAQQFIRFRGADLWKFCTLYSLESRLPLQPDVLWQKDRRVAVSFFLALLSQLIVASEEGHAKREQLLAWLPAKLKELPSEDFWPALAQVWMLCSYASGAAKHAIKSPINELLRARLLATGYRDATPPAAQRRKKPVLMCVLEWFYSTHAIYRTHSLSMEALGRRFELIGVSLRGASDEQSRKVFDRVEAVSATDSMNERVRHVTELVEGIKPDIIYYPSVGMFLETIMLINLRLAPVQMVGLGHPATTHSPFVDYVLVEEDYLGDPACFSERVVALPRDSMPYRPPANFARPAPRSGGAGSTVRIAVAATPMKINPVFLRTLRRVGDEAKVAVEFHFFSGMAFGFGKACLQNAVHGFLGGRAVVYPNLPYERYLERMRGCDMFVDPFPFGNTNGLVDTVRLGLPGVCLTGAEVHSHIDEGLFRRLGLPEWLIARSADEYVRAVVRLAEDSTARTDLTAQLLERDPDAILFRGRPERFAEAIAWLHRHHAKNSTGTARLLTPPSAA